MSAKQKLSLPRLRAGFFSCLSLALVFTCTPIQLRADSLEDAARALARKAASSLHGASVTCEVRNLSSLRGTEFSTLSAVFQEELQKHGAKVLPADAAGSVVLTVAENVSSYLGIVEIRRKEKSDTVMEPLGPIQGAPIAELLYSLVLHKEFLLEQDSPIVDVVLERDGRGAYALGPQGIAYYQRQGDLWVRTGNERLPVRRSSIRDPKGLLYFGVDREAAFFPGELCRISLPDAKGWSCEKSGEPMPVRSVSPSVIAEKKLGPWFSMAQFGPTEAVRTVVTGADGLARLYEEGPDPVSVFSGWGSELASIQSGCGHGWQLLVTGRGDWTHPDTIQAMEIRERRAQPVSSPIEIAGAVIALHSTAARNVDEASAGAEAVAIVRNLQTGRYEAYRLSITCPD